MQHRDPRLVQVPAQQREALAEIVKARGIAEAARFSGLGRSAVLAVVARGEVTRGTAALLREAFQRGSEGAPRSSAEATR